MTIARADLTGAQNRRQDHCWPQESDHLGQTNKLRHGGAQTRPEGNALNRAAFEGRQIGRQHEHHRSGDDSSDSNQADGQGSQSSIAAKGTKGDLADDAVARDGFGQQADHKASMATRPLRSSALPSRSIYSQQQHLDTSCRRKL